MEFRSSSTLRIGMVVVFALTLAHCSKQKTACEFQTDPSQIKLEWTAYKFTNKTPVKGRFNVAKVSGESKGESLSTLAKSMKMEIDGASVETDNPGRNATIQQFFFEKFNPPSKIEAQVIEVTGDDSQGTAQIEIQLNGVKKVLPFAYQVGADGTFTATGTFDMFQFNLQDAFNSIHQACLDKHTGEDGVSKTWSTVDLTLSGKITKICH